MMLLLCSCCLDRCSPVERQSRYIDKGVTYVHTCTHIRTPITHTYATHTYATHTYAHMHGHMHRYTHYTYTCVCMQGLGGAN